MPVLDLKLYTTISVCVALVAFLYSCDIFTLPFTTFSFQKWFLFTSSLTQVDNSQNEAGTDISTEHRSSSSNNIDESWGVPEKSPHVATSVFQNMLAERLTLKFFFGQLRVIESQTSQLSSVQSSFCGSDFGTKMGGATYLDNMVYHSRVFEDI
ncbi:1661_t:CDS:2 [Gigaspora margarita]|uniref:1661_t:CDS:1 n=1 Tax=Gigaspora margarita TaxID=4874 RepID=A0ABN7VH41_GIGMA|nr:1661_t:CDS:2 [Gigaspora margarita]